MKKERIRADEIQSCSQTHRSDKSFVSISLKHKLGQKVNLVISRKYLWSTEPLPVPVMDGRVMESNQMRLMSSIKLA